MTKKQIIILVAILIALTCAIVGLTLYFTLTSNETQKVNLNTIITTTEINGNEANDENSVFNKVVELHSDSGVTNQDIQIKENSFTPANNEQAGTATIEAQQQSNFIGEVDITITPLSVKIDLGQETLTYLAKVIYMNNISDNEANTIKSDLHRNITDKMNSLNLAESIDYQISDNLDTMQGGDNLNNFIHHISITSLAISEKATGSFIIALNVQEDIDNRIIDTVEVESNQVDGLTDAGARSIINFISIKVQSLLSQGQINVKDVDYQIVNLDLIQEGAKFIDYSNQLTVKGISSHLSGQFAINFAIEQIKNIVKN